MEASPDLPDAVVLALHLLEEKFKGLDSPWFTMIQGLPTTLTAGVHLSEVYQATCASVVKSSKAYDNIYYI
jgi:hypothetical protein